MEDGNPGRELRATTDDGTKTTEAMKKNVVQSIAFSQ
jgi:hypothetical protein